MGDKDQEKAAALQQEALGLMERAEGLLREANDWEPSKVLARNRGEVADQLELLQDCTIEAGTVWV